jgi:hypothetical protein
MKIRRWALSAAAVAVMAGGGLVVTAGPAAAVDDCPALYRASLIAAREMQRYHGVDFDAWFGWYDAWQDIEGIIEAEGC